MPSKFIEINVSGDTEEDMEMAMEEAFSKIKEGYLSGGDKNETGAYSFDINNIHLPKTREFGVYKAGVHDEEELVFTVDAEDAEGALNKALNQGVTNVSDVREIE